MRFVAIVFMVMVAGLASASEPESVNRQALVVAVPGPGGGVPPLVQAEAHALKLAEVLGAEAGFERVSTLVGNQISASDLVAGLEASIAATSDDGLLLVLLVARGAGGDFGDPALLTRGASVADPAATGLSIDALASALRPRTPRQSVVVMMDVAHADAVGGVALIGPSASDWPGLPEWGLAVTSKAQGEGGAPGIVFPVITDGLSGTADADFDGQVTISELAQFLDTSLGSQAGMPLDRSGAVAANLVLSTAGREASVPVASPSPALAVKQSKPFQLKPAAVGLVSAGVISGIVSVSMYASKRGECEDQGGRLVCGDDDAYRRYRAAQVALGWTSAGLVAAGIGVQFIPTSRGAMLGVAGRF